MYHKIPQELSPVGRAEGTTRSFWKKLLGTVLVTASQKIIVALERKKKKHKENGHRRTFFMRKGYGVWMFLIFS